MNHSKYVIILLLAMALGCTATLYGRPHIIFILADDLVSKIYGPAVHTKLRQKVKEVKQSAYRPITGLYPPRKEFWYPFPLESSPGFSMKNFNPRPLDF